MSEAERVKREAEYIADRDAMMRDRAWIESTVHRSLRETFKKVEELAAKANKAHGFAIVCGANDYRSCIMRSGFVSLGCGVASGLVASLNNPGGNLTRVSFLIGALTAKKLELLHELLPKVMAIGVLVNPNFPDTDVQLRDAQAAAQALRINLIVGKAATDGELETAFTTVVERRSPWMATPPSILSQKASTSHSNERPRLLTARTSDSAVGSLRSGNIFVPG
jgi:ABC transporter substrate binding protein